MGVYGLAQAPGRKLLITQGNGAKWCQNKSHVIGKISPRPNMSLYEIFGEFVEFTAHETPFMAVNYNMSSYNVFQGLKLA